ncbi:MAG: Wzz/FepE/Etk N-terminal domain-containing protein, partial [Actinocatenispora sp.]
MDVTRPAPADLRDHIAILRRNWWLVLALTALGLAAAAAATTQLPRTYESVTSVLVLPAGDQDANAEGGRTKATINLDTEAQLVRSTAVAARAGAQLHTRTAPSQLSDRVTVSVPPNSTVLDITFAAGDAHAAQAGSHAFATAYLANRVDAAQLSADADARALHAQVDKITGQLQDISTQLAGTANPSDQVVLQTKKRNLSQQLDALTSRLSETSATPVNGGRIISAASLPGSPASPVPQVNLAAGGVVGLILGFLVALLRARLDRRIRCADDVRRHVGIPVLAALTGPPDRLLPPTTHDGRIFSRLRNELTSPRDTRRPMVVVIGTSSGPAATAVAANLAAAFGRTGHDTVLVAAATDAALHGTASALVDVPATPGWSDVLTGGTRLDDALRAAPREPSLRVLPTGGSASASGLCQSEAARSTLTRLRELADHVVVAAPDARSGADAQTLASLADAAILAVEMRVTRREDVLDAVEQLHRVGTPLLGAVLVPAMAPITVEETADDPMADFTDGPEQADAARA